MSKKKKTNIKFETSDALHEKNQNNKINVSLILSILALIVAIVQLVVTTPYFTERYYKSSLDIVEIEPTISNQDYTTNYLVTNQSKNTVNNIEINIQMLVGDQIQLAPNGNIDFTYKENGPFFKDCYFKIEKLVPKENILVMIHSNRDSLVYYNRAFKTKGKSLINDSSITDENEGKEDYLTFPNISLAKFDKGVARIVRMPIEKRIR